MSEMIGSDETLFSLWPENFLTKFGGLDWTNKDQQLVPVPVVLLDDGRIAFRSDDGQLCLLDGLQNSGTESADDVLLPIPSALDDPSAELPLPTLSDAAIKSMLVDPDLSLVGSDIAGGRLHTDKDMLDLADCVSPEKDDHEHDTQAREMDDDLRSLVSFRCQYCAYCSPNVHSLIEHSKLEHPHIYADQPEETSVPDKAQTPDLPETQSEVHGEENGVVEGVGEVAVEGDLTGVHVEDDQSDQFVYRYLCSECNEQFESVEECRDHMIKDHDMILDSVKDGEDTVDIERVDEETAPAPSTPSSPVPSHPASPSPSQPPSPSPKTSDKLEVGKNKKQESPANTASAQPVVKLPRKPKGGKPKDYDPEFEAKPHRCPESFCAYKFRTLSYLELHKQCHVPEDGRRFCCPHCSVLFVRWNQCAIHLWKEHKVDVDLYTCTTCVEYKTTTRKKLQSHCRIHSDERPFKCPHCDKGFKQRAQMLNHTASVHNKNDTAFPPKWYMSQKCEICHKTYADSKVLKKHMQAVHSKLKPYKCQICGHMSAFKAMMQAHMRQHTGEKPYVCQLCEFRTGDHNSLRRHVMLHTGKRPYRCPHCNYSCIQSSSLKLHIQHWHQGKKGMYSCDECYFVTVNKDSYHKHLSDHKLNLIPAVDSDVEVWRENVAAAHLVYRSFGASPCRLRSDVTGSATSRDGTKQTITISIPFGDEEECEGGVTDDEDTTQCYILDTGGITIPAEPEPDPQPQPEPDASDERMGVD